MRVDIERKQHQKKASAAIDGNALYKAFKENLVLKHPDTSMGTLYVRNIVEVRYLGDNVEQVLGACKTLEEVQRFVDESRKKILEMPEALKDYELEMREQNFRVLSIAEKEEIFNRAFNAVLQLAKKQLQLSNGPSR